MSRQDDGRRGVVAWIECWPKPGIRLVWLLSGAEPRSTSQEVKFYITEATRTMTCDDSALRETVKLIENQVKS